MRLTAIAGILVLLNVLVYLILVGFIGLPSLFHYWAAPPPIFEFEPY